MMVSEAMKAPLKANSTVRAMGWKSLPSMPRSASTGT